MSEKPDRAAARAAALGGVGPQPALGRRSGGSGATLRSYLHFIWAGVVKQGQTGAIVPSQRFLIAKMIAPVPESYQGEIVELGAGTGAFTLPLAARCPAARILACELNPVLAQHCRDRLALAGLQRRVTVVAAPAEEVLAQLREKGTQPDYVLSGIPLGNFSREKVLALVNAIRQTLCAGGLYIQYQHSLLDRKKIRDCFSSLRTAPVLLNFPPAVVYYARK